MCVFSPVFASFEYNKIDFNVYNIYYVLYTYIGIACIFGMRTDLYLILHCEWFFVRGISKQRVRECMQQKQHAANINDNSSSSCSSSDGWFSDSVLFYYSFFSFCFVFRWKHKQTHIGEAIWTATMAFAHSCKCMNDVILYVHFSCVRYLFNACIVFIQNIVLFDMGKLTIKQKSKTALYCSVAHEYQETSEER